jgi:hypothetical protein
LVWKSLKTATFSMAKQRLPQTLRDHRSKIEAFTAFTEGKMTVGDAAKVYRHKVRVTASLKRRSKDYRELIITAGHTVQGPNRFIAYVAFQWTFGPAK